MRNDLVTVASGWVSDCAIADLVGFDDPTDALVPTRAPTPELALVGALLAVAIGAGGLRAGLHVVPLLSVLGVCGTYLLARRLFGGPLLRRAS